jgi:hypothetical protein
VRVVCSHHSISALVRGQKDKTIIDFNTPHQKILINDLMLKV